MLPKVKSTLSKINLRSSKFIIAATLLVLIPLSVLILSLNKSQESKTPEWKTYDEQVKEGKIKPAGKILEVVMEYKADKTQPIAIKKLSQKNGYAGTVIPEENTYRMQLLNFRHVVIAQQYFSISNTARGESFEKDGTIHGEDIVLDNVSFAVTLPWKDAAEKIVVIDNTGRQLFASDISQVEKVNNKPEFTSIGGDEFMEMQKKKINLRVNKAYAQDAGGKVDIVFIGTRYSDMGAFRADADRFIHNLTQYEPFSSRASQLNFHIVENADDLQCQNYRARGILCDESVIVQRINSAGVPHEAIGVIIKASEYRAAAMNIAFVSNAVDDHTMTHELGHSLGRLMDEYAYDGESVDGQLTNQIYRLGKFDNVKKTAPLIPGEGNCFAGNPPASGWNGMASENDYRKRCTYLNWYASSQSSVMKTTADGSHFFNTASQRLLNKRLDAFVRGGNPDLGPGADVYGINRNGGSGKTEVHTLSGAANFKDFSTHAATGLHSTAGNGWSFALGNFYDDDYIPDIFAINRNGGSGKTEVHVLSGRNDFADFGLHAATALETTAGDNWVFDVGFGPDDDPRVDLFAINKQGGSGKTEVHILQGGPGKDFNDFSLHAESGLHTTDKNWNFVVGSFSGDPQKPDDVYAINRRGGSGKTEVHVLSGESNYRDFSIHTDTALDATDNANWSFTLGYFDNDSRADLYAINRRGGSGKTEVHILSAASDFKNFIMQSASALEPTNSTNWTFAPSQDYNGTSSPDPVPSAKPSPTVKQASPTHINKPPTSTPTKPPIGGPNPTSTPQPTSGPVPTWVCGGSPDSICATATPTPRPTTRPGDPNPTLTQPTQTLTGVPSITPVPGDECLDPRSTPEKLQNWVRNFWQKIIDFIQRKQSNPQNPEQAPQPCIRQ